VRKRGVHPGRCARRSESHSSTFKWKKVGEGLGGKDTKKGRVPGQRLGARKAGGEREGFKKVCAWAEQRENSSIGKKKNVQVPPDHPPPTRTT